MKSPALLAVFLFFGIRSLASVISPGGDCSFTGTVVDAASKRPVANVTIVAKGLKKTRRYITNDEGKFTIPVSEDSVYTFTFEKPDYKPLEKKNIVIKNNSDSVNIQLLQKESGTENHHNWLLKINFQ